MGFVRRLLKRIPYVEAFRAFLEQWGLWAYVKIGGASLMGGIVAVWAWIESNLPYWAVALVGMGAAALIFAIIVMVQHIRSGHRMTAATAPATPTEESDERWSDTPQFNRRGLYVGQMIVYTDEAASRSRVKVLIRVFNGTNRPLSFLRIEGNFRIENNGASELTSRPVLHPPELSQDSSKIVEVNEEATLTIDQHVTDDFGALLASATELVLSCKHLRIIMEEPERKRPIDLPIWDGVLLSKKTDEFCTRRGFWNPMRRRPEFN